MSKRSAYRIEQGGVARRVYGARDQITRESHALVVQTSDGLTAKDQPHNDWWGDLRRGRMSIYGGILRFIDHLHRRNVPMETALMIPRWLESYVRDVYGDEPIADAIPLELVRTGEYPKAA